MRTFIISMAIIALATTCSKKSHHGKNNELVGRWMLKQTLVSPGPMGEWTDYTGMPAFLDFKSDGTVHSMGMMRIGNDLDHYLVRDNRIVFYKNFSTDSLQTSYSFTRNGLEIMMGCIEPCGVFLVRIGEL